MLEFLRKNLVKTKHCGRWYENVDVTLLDSVSSKEVEFEKILSINVDVFQIFVGKNRRCNKTL